MTTRRIWLTGMAATFVALATARRGQAATTAIETRSVSGFDEIVWDAVGELHIEQTQREHLSVEAEPAVLRRIVTEVRRRRLHIGFAPGRVQTREPIRFRLEVKSLTALEARGSGEIRIGRLSTAGLSLRLEGSDSLSLAHLNARTLEARLDGAGDVVIAGGEVLSQRVLLSGAGRYAALGLASRQAEVAIDGSGDARVAASERLIVSIAGSGDVHYRGNPQIAHSVTGAGSLRRAKNS